MSPRFFGKRKAHGEMNKLEAAYAAELERRKRAGEVERWLYEAVKLRLADRTFYTPDFFVVLPDGEVQVHEAKGFMQDDAAVKLKVAAATFPFAFYLVKAKLKRDGGGFTVEEV